jgi:hypothetical protein
MKNVPSRENHARFWAPTTMFLISPESQPPRSKNRPLIDYSQVDRVASYLSLISECASSSIFKLLQVRNGP